MSLQVTERQTVEQWYELSGNLEARELFPTLLPNSQTAKEIDEEEPIETEREGEAGRYDGYPQEDDEMEGEIAEFTESALSEFHDEALTAAKARLAALKPEQTLLCGDFEDVELVILEEAAEAMGVAIPWDPAEAAEIAADKAARHAANIVHAQKRVAEAQTLLDKNAAAIARAKDQNKPQMLVHEESLRQLRVSQLEEARRALESLMAEDSLNAVVAV